MFLPLYIIDYTIQQHLDRMKSSVAVFKSKKLATVNDTTQKAIFQGKQTHKHVLIWLMTFVLLLSLFRDDRADTFYPARLNVPME